LSRIIFQGSPVFIFLYESYLVVGGQDHFTGSFTNDNIQFTYDPNNSDDKSGKIYSGTINDASTEMTLQGNGLPNLTLQKQ